MKLTRIMKIENNEIEKIIRSGKFKFNKKTCWSGENTNKNTWFEVAGHFSGTDVFVTYNGNEKDFTRPSDIEKETTADDWKDTDEYRNINDLELDIDDYEWLVECIDEDGFENWLNNACDTGYIELELK